MFQRHLSSLAIAGYRSFGSEVQRFAQFEQINILIGQNNCGKSNVLRFLNDWLAKADPQSRPPLGEHDRHQPNRPGMVVGFRVACGTQGVVDHERVQQLFKSPPMSDIVATLSAALRRKMSRDGDQDGAWFYSDENGTIDLPEWEDAFAAVSDSALSRLWGHLTGC